MKVYAIIVAGGSGKRFGGSTPKQFIELAGRPILMYTIDSVAEYFKDISIVVVLPKKHIAVWEKMCSDRNFNTKHDIVAGGEERFFSVQNAIRFLYEKGIEADDLVAIHDGVRPFASKDTWQNSILIAKERGNAVPCLPAIESVRFIDKDSNSAINRQNIRTIQTPQVFRFELLYRAYQQTFSNEFTDDASVVEKLGEKIYLAEGNRENIKITTPFDVKIGEIIISK